MIFDSEEERLFTAYLDELKQAGFVKSYDYQPAPYKLTEKVTHKYKEIKVLKTKTKEIEKEQIILPASEYTPDYKVIWDRSADGIFINILEESAGRPLSSPFLAHTKIEGGAEVIYSVMEVKGTYDKHGSIRIFKNNRQLFVYALYGEFVNMVVVPTIFEKTFVPEAYKLTPTGKQKKIDFKINTLEDFIHGSSKSSN